MGIRPLGLGVTFEVGGGYASPSACGALRFAACMGCGGDSEKVVFFVARGFGVFHYLPVEQVRRHYVSIFVGGCAEIVCRGFVEIGDDGAGDGFFFVIGDV